MNAKIYLAVLAALFCRMAPAGAQNVCPPPAALTSTVTSGTTATVAWSAVPNVSFYQVQYRPVNSPTPVWQSVTSSTAGASLSGLVCNTGYEWQVRSGCGGNGGTNVTWSAFTQSALFTTASCQTTCLAPTGLNSSNITSNGASVSWNASLSAFYYIVRYRPSPSPSVTGWQYQVVQTGNASLTNLYCGTAYEWQVRSVCSNVTFSNVASMSPFTASSYFTTLACLPGCPAPTGLTSANVSSVFAMVSWNAVSQAVYYQVRYRPTLSPVATPWQMATSSTASTGLGGLLCNTGYEWQVRSVCGTSTNVATLSPWSALANFTTQPCNTNCATPTGLTSTTSSINGVMVTWNATSALSYNIRYRQANTLTWMTTTSAINSKLLTGLNGQTLYEWQVQGVCSSNTGATTLSAWSASAYFTSPSPMPLTATVEASRIVVFQESAAQQPVRLTLRNMMGQVVRSENLDVVAGMNQYTINTDGLSNGLYVIEVAGEGKREVVKVYVQKW